MAEIPDKLTQHRHTTSKSIPNIVLSRFVLGNARSTSPSINMALSLPSPTPEASVWATMLKSRAIVILKHPCTVVFNNSNYSTLKTLLMLSDRSLNFRHRASCI